MPTTVFPEIHAEICHYQFAHHNDDNGAERLIDDSYDGYELEISRVVISPI